MATRQNGRLKGHPKQLPRNASNLSRVSQDSTSCSTYLEMSEFRHASAVHSSIRKHQDGHLCSAVESSVLEEVVPLIQIIQSKSGWCPRKTSQFYQLHILQNMELFFRLYSGNLQNFSGLFLRRNYTTRKCICQGYFQLSHPTLNCGKSVRFAHPVAKSRPKLCSIKHIFYLCLIEHISQNLKNSRIFKIFSSGSERLPPPSLPQILPTVNAPKLSKKCRCCHRISGHFKWKNLPKCLKM